MPRSRQRVRLEDGLRLDLNRLCRLKLVTRGRVSGPRTIRWTYMYPDEIAATGLVEADMRGNEGWLRIQLDDLDQHVALASQPRHFGGRQWYFVCPVTGRQVSVLWMPPGAPRFRSRHAWPRRVAYGSQFEDRYSRSLAAAHRIRYRLGGALWAPMDGTDPPRPKWMRRRTYERLLDRADRYEAIADERVLLLARRWGVLG